MPPPPNSQQTLTLHHDPQNLFSNISPYRTTLLIHACNTQGAWGAGVALEMKRRFPGAYEAYHAYCLEMKEKNNKGEKEGEVKRERDEIVGTCMTTFITPAPTPGSDTSSNVDGNITITGNTTGKLLVANLFTRRTYGPLTHHERANPAIYTTGILNATASAMSCLLSGLVDLVEAGALSEQDVQGMEMRMPKINSGRFMVEWELTRGMLEGVVVPGRLRGGGTRVVVCCAEEEG